MILIVKRIVHLVVTLWGIILMGGLVYLYVIKPLPTADSLSSIQMSHYRVVCAKHYNKWTYYRLRIIHQGIRFDDTRSFHELQACHRVQRLIQHDGPLTLYYEPMRTFQDAISGRQDSTVLEYDIYGLTGDKYQYRTIADSIADNRVQRRVGQIALIAMLIIVIAGIVFGRRRRNRRRPYYHD